MRILLIAGAALVVMFGSSALAHPVGAPWGSANPDTMTSCASCHFDHEPVGRSPAIMLTGLPDYVEAGEAYEMTLRFDAGAAPRAGFLLSASAGEFKAIDDIVDAKGAEVRSANVISPENGVALWSFVWRAGDDGVGIVTFRAAANAANDDASPFGDTVHFRKFDVLMRTGKD